MLPWGWGQSHTSVCLYVCVCVSVCVCVRARTRVGTRTARASQYRPLPRVPGVYGNSLGSEGARQPAAGILPRRCAPPDAAFPRSWARIESEGDLGRNLRKSP
jgi:hypothetical protein